MATFGLRNPEVLPDDFWLAFGLNLDIKSLLRSTTLAANTALTGVLLGTPVSPALAANTLIISNTTASGQILVAANRGGNSEAYIDIDPANTRMTLIAPTTLRFQLGTTQAASLTASVLTVPTAGPHVFGAGSTSTNHAQIEIDSGSGSAALARINFKQNSVIQGSLGLIVGTDALRILDSAGASVWEQNFAGSTMTFTKATATAVVMAAQGSGNNNAGSSITLQGGSAGTSTTGNIGGDAILLAGAAGGTGNNNGGRTRLTTGAATGTGLKPLVELDAAGGVPTTAVLTSGYAAIRYVSASTAVLYVNDGGVIKSVSLGTPA